MSTFTDALAAFNAAEREFRVAERAMAYWRATDPQEVPDAYAAAAQRLAQAGDVLERELRQMIREERPGLSFAGKLKPQNIPILDDE